MSRTYRSKEVKYKIFRSPATAAEKRVVEGFIEQLHDMGFFARPRDRKRVKGTPSAWDDMHIAAIHEVRKFL